MFSNEGEAIWLTAQEAAERMLTIKLSYVILAGIILLAIWLLVLAWKYSEDRRKEETDNARDRIAVTRTIGKAVTDALKEDGNWREQFFALKAKYDALEAHCENMEKVLDSAKGRNGFQPSEVSK